MVADSTVREDESVGPRASVSSTAFREPLPLRVNSSDDRILCHQHQVGTHDPLGLLETRTDLYCLTEDVLELRVRSQFLTPSRHRTGGSCTHYC